MSTRAALLVNLGSPDSTSVRDVRRYLNEFLSDDRVLDYSKIVQQVVVKAFILPTRPKKSAHAYELVWTEDGSPLVAISKQLREKVQERSEIPVALAMRYGSPSIESVLRELVRNGVEELFLVPLYPHYAMSSYETVVARVEELLRVIGPHVALETLKPFYDDAEYVEALYESAKSELEAGYDHLLFSYHSIPVRHLAKADVSHAHCGVVADCCTTVCPAHDTCYKAQATRTTHAFVERAGIPRDKWSMSFQSRLGREKWIEPYTDKVLEKFGAQKMKRLLVITPAFVSDCLETLEEIAIRGKESFESSGGGEMRHIPCLNTQPLWVDFVASRIEEWRLSRVDAPRGAMAE